MIIVWGTRLYGKVDEVPGLFHVETSFFHMWYLPLIPLGSHVVIAKSGNSWRGAKVALSGKSVLVAWARLWLLVGGVVFGMIGFSLITDRRAPMILEGSILMAIGALLLGAGIAVWVKKSIRQASYARAVELAEKIGLSEEGLVLIELAFKRVSEADAKATLERLRADAAEIERLKEEQTLAHVRATSPFPATPPTAPPTTPPTAPPLAPRDAR